jgi:hypothetical protein
MSLRDQVKKMIGSDEELNPTEVIILPRVLYPLAL